MILDNENENLKVHEWISKYTEEGSLDIVTGYFTIGALAFLSKQTNDRISKYRMVLGDIVNIDAVDERPLDLLNENITIEAALQLSSIAQEAVNFLKQDNVLLKHLSQTSVEEQVMEDGSIKQKMGSEAKDVLARLKRGNKNEVHRIKEGTTTTEKYQLDQFDLITWFIISL